MVSVVVSVDRSVVVNVEGSVVACVVVSVVASVVQVLLRPLSNNTKATSQCVNCLIFIHTVTTALSNYLSEPLHMAVI